MKISQVDDNHIKEILKITDLENSFDIFVDKKLNRMFNLNQSIYVKVDKDSLPKFQCNQVMHWPLISYKIYGTTRLAWLLWKVNEVSAIDTFNAKHPGDIIYYLPNNIVQDIVSNINSFNS